MSQLESVESIIENISTASIMLGTSAEMVDDPVLSEMLHWCSVAVALSVTTMEARIRQLRAANN